MLSLPWSTFPTFTIGTNVGLSMSTSRSSGFTLLPKTAFCATLLVAIKTRNNIIKERIFLIMAQK